MRSVLIIEPDEALAALLELVLNEEGYVIEVADGLDQAEAVLRHSHFDAIITEAFDQDTLFHFDAGFLQRLRAASGGIPIVLCSTDTYALGLRPGDFGLADVICKPLDVDELPKRIKKVAGTP